MMQINRSHSSPNFEARRGFMRPELVILHYTGMADGMAAIRRLCDAASKVSAHYVVEEDGRVFQLVDEQHRAWHAGRSFWRGITDINSASLGIEIVNPGHEFGYRAFPDVQMQAVLALCGDIKKRYALPAEAFIGHSDIAPQRKEDPGEKFNWAMLAAAGIGIWPDESAPGAVLSNAQARQWLAEIGYEADVAVMPDEAFSAVIRAFQRHYVQNNLGGVVDAQTSAALRAVHAAVSRQRAEAVQRPA